MISNGGTSTLGLYDFKKQLDAFGGVDYFRSTLVGGYIPNARVMLANGEIVQNSTNGNLTNNPNTDMTGWVKSNSTSQIFNENERSQQDINNDSLNVRSFGAIGDGTLHTLQEWVDGGKFANLTEIKAAYDFANSLTDSIDYVVIAQVFKNANTKVRTGLVSTIKNSGACVYIPNGSYNMQGITQALKVMCNVKNDGALFLIPQTYSGTVIEVGSFVNSENLAAADIELPDVAKPVSNNPLVAGSIGYRIANLNASRLKLGRTSYFETGVWLGGVGEGTVYNTIHLGQHNYCKQVLRIQPDTNGWCNSNRFFGGNLQQSAGFAGGVRSAGWSFLYVDGRSPATAVVGNTFIGTSFEGNASDYAFDFYGAYGNTFIGCYHETGAAFTNVTVSGSTLTSVGHSLVVGDQIAFIATTLPTGMLDGQAYYVVSVSGDTFSVSSDKTGAAITFSTTGADVKYILAARFRFNTTGGGTNCFNNKLLNMFTPPSIFLDIVQTNQAYNNGLDKQDSKIIENYDPSTKPIYRARNTFTTTNAPVFAAYKSSIKQTENPYLWGAALTGDGLAWRDSGSDLGYLSNSVGILKYKRPADTRTYDIASCTRSPSLLNVSALSVPANGRVITTVTLTGVAIGELVTCTPYSALVDGIGIAWVRVSAADTIQLCFYNWTTSPISLTAQFQIMSTRAFY